MIDSAALPHATPGSVLSVSLAGGLICGAGALIVTSVPVVAMIAAVIVALLPFLLLRRRARARTRSVRTAWPDALDSLASAVRAGMSLPEALADLSARGPVSLRPAFASFAGEYRVTGSFTDALRSLQSAAGDPVADRVIAALRIAREVGGTDLGIVLRTLSSLLRADLRMRGEIEARQSWTVSAARLAVAAPWITLALLSTRPEAAAAYRSTLGAVILIICTGVTVLAYRLMLAIGRLPDEPRTLA
ncbi:MAG: type II secretion system F family protein [Candidatus Nanopelagicales bacterium]